MKMSNIIEGLQILSKYFDDKEGFRMGAEHDIIYVYSTDSPVMQEDLDRLEALGWMQPEVDDGEPYDSDESWGAYV